MNRLTLFGAVLGMLLLGGCGVSQPAAQSPETVSNQLASEEIHVQEQDNETKEVPEASLVASANDSVVQETVDAVSEPSNAADENAVQVVASQDEHDVGSVQPVDSEPEPDPSFVRCEVRIEDGDVFSASAAGPTVEEAKDNAVDEACAIPCAQRSESAQLSDDELNEQIEKCTEKCSDEANVTAVSCYQFGKLVFSESGENDDAGEGLLE